MNNPIGLLLDLDTPTGAQVAQTLGATYFRPVDAIVLEGWNGECREADIAKQLGFQLLLSVRNNGGGMSAPTTPPTDLAAYKTALAAVLDKYPPMVLAVENEENSSIFYTGTPEEYGVELRAAIEVAHAKGIKVSNGGTVSALVALLTWDNYLTQGNVGAASSYCARAFDPSQKKSLEKITAPRQYDARTKEQIQKGKGLLEQYKTSGMDYMNFHWYINDAAALGESAAFLSQAVGKPLVVNEMGQQNDDPAVVRPLLQKAVDLGFGYAVWFSVDAPQAKSLYDSTTGALRSNGQEFKNFMTELFYIVHTLHHLFFLLGHALGLLRENIIRTPRDAG